MDTLVGTHEYVFVFMLVTIFTVKLCAHTISFDDTLVCFLSCLHIIASREEVQTRRPARVYGLTYGLWRFLCGNAYYFF